MASGAVTIRVIDDLGISREYGVPGENDITEGFIVTKPLDCGTVQVGKTFIAALLEANGDVSDLTFKAKVFNHLQDEEGTDYVSLGEPPDSDPMYWDEDDVRSGRLTVVRIEDSSLGDWSVMAFALWGEFEGDEDQLI